MGNYNPHVPQILGQEWVPIRDEDLVYAPGVNSVELGTSYTQSSSQRIRDARFYLHEMQPTLQAQQIALVNLYPKGLEDITGPIQQVIIPCNSGAVTGSQILVTNNDVPFSVYQPGDGNRIAFFYAGGLIGEEAAQFFFNVSAFPQLAGKRILNVSLLYSGYAQADDDAQNIVPFTSPNNGIPATIIRIRNNAGTSYDYSSAVGSAISNMGALGDLATSISNPAHNASASQVIGALDLGDINHWWETAAPNFDSVMPWRYQDLQRFEATNPNRLHIYLRTQLQTTSSAAVGGAPFIIIEYIALRVTYCEETRVAFGGKQVFYKYGMNSIALRDLSFNADPVITAGQYTPTLSWVSPGQVDFGEATNGDFPKLNALRQLYEIPSHPGVRVNVPFPLEDHIGDTFTKETTHILPQLSLHASGGTLTEPHVYGRQAAAQVYGTITATQEIQDTTLFGTAAFPQVRYYARRFGDTTVPLTLSGPQAGLALSSVPGAYASTVDNAALDIVGDIDLRVDLAAQDWTPPGGGFTTLLGKWTGPANFSYRFGLLPGSGQLQFAWSTTGAGGGVGSEASSVPVVPDPITGRLAVRVTVDVDNGAAGHTVIFYTAPTMAGPFVQLGATITAAPVISFFSGSAALEVGSNTNGSAELTAGVFYAAEVRNGIAGAVVANPNFAAQPPGTTSFNDAAGRPWTVNGTARIVASPSNIVLTPAEWDALPEVLDGWKEITKQFSSPPVFGAINPQWRWSASGELAGNRWEVIGAIAPAISGVPGSTLTQVPPPQRLDVATYGAPSAGSTINLDWAPGYTPLVTTTTDDPLSDAVLIFSQDPAAVTGFGVTTQTQALTTYADCPGGTACCAPTALLYNRVAWNSIGSALSLPGVSGSYASTPDNAALDIVGDIDLRIDLALTDWTPAVLQDFIAKWNDATQNAYLFRLNSITGLLELVWSTTGADFPAASATVPVPIADGGRLTIRVTLDVNNGAGGRTITFYTAPTIDGPWTQLGVPVVQAGVTSIFSSTMQLEVGARNFGATEPVAGTIYAAQVRNGIDGTIVANPNFTAQTPGTTSFTDSAGRVWTINGTAAIVAAMPFNVSAIELQRLDAIDNTWDTIMLSSSPVTGFNDYEARVGVLSSYRIRQVNVLDFAGPWSSTAAVTLLSPGVSGGACLAQGHVLIFTTNERQDGSSNLAYSNSYEGEVVESFTFPEAGFTQYQAMYNRDFFTAFRPTERGGEQFSRDILVSAAAIPPETLADFTDLRDMAWDSVPYICVRDEDGNRWFANVTVPGGNVRNQRRLYQAVVGIVEVTNTPSQVNP